MVKSQILDIQGTQWPRENIYPYYASTLPALISITASILADSGELLVTILPAYASPRKPNLGMSTSMAPHIPSPHGQTTPTLQAQRALLHHASGPARGVATPWGNKKKNGRGIVFHDKKSGVIEFV